MIGLGRGTGGGKGRMGFPKGKKPLVSFPLGFALKGSERPSQLGHYIAGILGELGGFARGFMGAASHASPGKARVLSSSSSRSALGSSLVEKSDTRAIPGQDWGDDQSAVGCDLVAMGLGELLDESVARSMLSFRLTAAETPIPWQ